MSFLTAEHQGTLSRLMDGEPRRRSVLETHNGRHGPHPGWMITGLVVLGLGVAGWYYLGPDVRRYIKILNM
jgi:hypothetical protein